MAAVAVERIRVSSRYFVTLTTPQGWHAGGKSAQLFWRVHVMTGDQDGGGIVGFPYPPKGSGLGQVATALVRWLPATVPSSWPDGCTLRRGWDSGCSGEKKLKMDCNPAILVREKPGRLAGRNLLVGGGRSHNLREGQSYPWGNFNPASSRNFNLVSQKRKKNSGRHSGWPFWPRWAGPGRPPRPGGEEAAAGRELRGGCCCCSHGNGSGGVDRSAGTL